MREKVLLIEFSHENTAGNGYFYSDLYLPAEEHEIQDALQKARIINTEEFRPDITVMNNSYLNILSNVRLDSPTIDELNFLSKRLAAMDGTTQLIYEAVIQANIADGEIVSMKKLINCTYGLEDVMVAAHVTDDTQLGAFIIENELYEDVNAVPEASRYLLDFSQIGELYRKNFGTVYAADLCVFTGYYDMPEVYDGRQLPANDTSAWYAFRLCVAKTPTEDDKLTDKNAGWISLPMDKAEANRIASLHGERCIENCVYYDFESSVPQITSEMFGSMEDFDKINRLAVLIAEMSPSDQIKFKAVLESEKPAGIEGILDVADHLHLYEMNTAVTNDDEFFKSYLARHLDSHFDREWLDSLCIRAEASRLLDRLGATVTDYGAISARGRSLYEIVPYSRLEEQEQTAVLNLSQ